MTIWLDQCPRALRTRPPQVGKWGRNHGVVEAPSSWGLVTEADQGAVSGHAPSGVAPTEGAEICGGVTASSSLPVVERLCKNLVSTIFVKTRGIILHRSTISKPL